MATIFVIGIAILAATSFGGGKEKKMTYLGRCISLFYVPATGAFMTCLYGTGITDNVFDSLLVVFNLTIPFLANQNKGNLLLKKLILLE